MASIRIPIKSKEEKNSRNHSIEYGIVKIEEITLPLDKEETVKSIHRDNSGRYLILSKAKEQNLIIWDSKTNTIVSRIKNPVFPYWIVKARLLPIDGMIFCDTLGTPSPHPVVFQTDPFQPVPVNGILAGISQYAIVTSANKTKLIGYHEPQRTIKFLSIEMNAVDVNHTYLLSSFFPDSYHSENIHCVGLCNLPGKIPRVAICIQDLTNKKEHIRIVNVDVLTNSLDLGECVDIPNIRTKKDRCGHDKGIFCLPDGRLVYSANYCRAPTTPKGVVKFDNFNRIILFSEPEWKITYSNVSDTRKSTPINIAYFNIFPYTQFKKLAQPDAASEFKSCMPHLGREMTLRSDWEALPSLCQHTFFSRIPDSINPHKYAYYEVAEINFQLLERMLGREINLHLHTSLPMVLCMLIASLAIDLSMFAHETVKQAATLRATAAEREEKLDVALRSHF